MRPEAVEHESPIAESGRRPVTRSKGPALLAILITLIVVVAVLATLLMNAAGTGLFLRTPPQGQNAMGLVVPFFGLGAAILALTFAAVLAAFRASASAVGAVAASPVLAGFLVIVLTFGAALAAGMAFMLWCEPGAAGTSLRAVTVPIGIVLGVCGPVVLGGMLLAAQWVSKDAAAAALARSGGLGLVLRTGFVAVCLLALSGYGLGGAMFWKEIRRGVARQAAAVTEAIKEREQRSAEERLPAAERLTRQFAEFSPTAPLWTVIAFLPDRPGEKKLDDECRAIVVQRALKVPDFNTELMRCMQSTQYIYRQGAAEFLIAVPEPELAAHRDAWGRALLAGLSATGEGIYCRPAWLSETFDSKPDPLGHVRSLLGAAERFTEWGEYAEIRRLLQKMADDAGMLNADSKREKLLKLLSAAGYRAAEVRPRAGR